jgi:hypothetical protein
MLRRLIVAFASGSLAWLVLSPAAGAQTYPPAPLPPSAVPGAPLVSPVVPEVVVVRGAPVAPGGALVRTGTSATAPLVALATGSVGFGVALAVVARRRPTARPSG